MCRTRTGLSLCVFYFPKEHRLFFCLDITVRAFYIAGILSFEKTFGGDAEIERK